MPAIPHPLLRWTFWDPVDDETYVFEVNPREGGSLRYEKNITTEVTVANDGRALVWEGRDMPQQSSFSGTILSENQFQTFVTWYNRRRQIKLTDDLGREMWIYIKRFDPTRKRTVHYPWRHDYTVEFVVVDWP